MPLPSHMECAAIKTYAGAQGEQQVFLDTLLHDDRGSCYVLSSDEGGTWVDTPVKRVQIPCQRFDSTSNYYITHNGFSDRRRKLESCRQVNALFFDLDCHGASRFECRRLVAEAQRLIQSAVERGDLPQPTMVVDSGRGLHLYYVLERSIPYRVKVAGSYEVNSKTVGFMRDVQSRLADLLDELLSSIGGMEVDRSVFDLTRVSRIPGTYNAKARRCARLTASGGPMWHLPELASYKRAERPQSAPNAPCSAKVVRFNGLMWARLKKVYDLQAYRGCDCEGRRELMCFVFYNTAVQLYDRAEAKKRLHGFNARFSNPLDPSELENICGVVDTVVNLKGGTGHYILTAQTLIRLLGLTQQEMDDLCFFSSKRAIERAEAKRRTRERREERDRRVCDLYSTGEYTQQQIAGELGIDRKTVYRILKTAGMGKWSRQVPEESPEPPLTFKEALERKEAAAAMRNGAFPGNRVLRVVRRAPAGPSEPMQVYGKHPFFRARTRLPAPCGKAGRQGREEIPP